MSDDPPRGPDGIGYAMWIFRFKRGDRFEEIHVARHGAVGEARAMRTRARALADETGSAVSFTEAIITACYDFAYRHVTMRPLWQVEWPRTARDPGPFVAWEVTECPNLETHHQPRPS